MRSIGSVAAILALAAGAATAQTFDLTAGREVRADIASARALGVGETATLTVALDPRGLGPGDTISVISAEDGRLLGAVSPFGTRARTTPGVYTMTLDERALATLRVPGGLLALRFRVESAAAAGPAHIAGSARIERLEIKIERLGE